MTRALGFGFAIVPEGRWMRDWSTQRFRFLRKVAVYNLETAI